MNSEDYKTKIPLSQVMIVVAILFGLIIPYLIINHERENVTRCPSLLEKVGVVVVEGNSYLFNSKSFKTLISSCTQPDLNSCNGQKDFELLNNNVGKEIKGYFCEQTLVKYQIDNLIFSKYPN